MRSFFATSDQYPVNLCKLKMKKLFWWKKLPFRKRFLMLELYRTHFSHNTASILPEAKLTPKCQLSTRCQKTAVQDSCAAVRLHLLCQTTKGE